MPCSNISGNSRMYVTYFLIYGHWPKSYVIVHDIISHDVIVHDIICHDVIYLDIIGNSVIFHDLICHAVLTSYTIMQGCPIWGGMGPPNPKTLSPPVLRAQYPSICLISLQIRWYLTGFKSNILHCVSN